MCAKEKDNSEISENQDITIIKKEETSKTTAEEISTFKSSKVTPANKKEDTPNKIKEEKATPTEEPSVSDEEPKEVSASKEIEVKEKVKEDSFKDYTTFSKEELIEELKAVIKDKPIQQIKNDVEEIRAEFNSKFNQELVQNKKSFVADGGNIIDFYYSTPLKKEFSSIYFDYKDKLNKYYKNLSKDLRANLAKRLELIEELKSLLNAEENINTTYKHFKDIQERWFESGVIPRDKYNIVWNTYRHHVENFYDFLHLNREFRDLDFKHNLEQKLKLIDRAEKLAEEENINKSFRELQMLHKMWKEEIGPVAKGYREDVWEKFSAATKVIHDKRLLHLKDLEQDFEENLNLKKEIINEINQITKSIILNHQGWQNAIKKAQILRDKFFETGKVSHIHNKEIWSSFKESTRLFNKEKNIYYKNQKKEQYNNLAKKHELIKIADENKDIDEFEVVTPLMKKIQNDWKNIGHVPRKESDKVWKLFKEACNHYFDRLHSKQEESNKEEFEHYKLKEELLDSLSSLKPKGNPEDDIKTIKDQIKAWKEIGRVPYNKRNIERKFNKTLDNLFNQLDMDKKEIELIKFEYKINTLVTKDDDRKLQNEEFFISKKIDEAIAEIRQLENNLGFFQQVDENNPLVKEVNKNIEKLKKELEVWKAKLSKIRSIRKG